MKKIMLIISAFIIGIMINTLNVSAVNGRDVTNSTGDDAFFYFIQKLSLNNDNTLNIRGYGYVLQNQNYYEWNHKYSIILQGNSGATSKSYDLNNFNQKINLAIGGVYTKCGLTERSHINCERIIESAGFDGNVNLTDAINDLGADNSTEYTVYLQVEEYSSGQTLKTKIKTIANFIGTNVSTSEYKNIVFSLNPSDYTNKWINISQGVRARNGAGAGYIFTYDVGMPKPPTNRSNMYMCTEGVCGADQGEFTYAGYGTDAYGIYWFAAYSHPTYNIDWTYGGNYTLAPGGGILTYETTAYIKPAGEYVKLYKTKKSYAGINNITTYTAKSGDTTKVTATYYNNKANSPVYYKLCVDGAGCTENTSTATGIINIEKEVTASKTDRNVTFYINETYTNTPADISSKLYAASSNSVILTNESGTYTSPNPIKVTKNYGQEAVKEYEVITYENPQNYKLTNGDYAGAELTRKTSLSYYSAANNGSIYNSTQKLTNTISSPYKTTNATIIENTPGKISQNDTIYVPFVNLDSKTIKTTYAGVGVNNMTIILQSNFNYDNYAKISKIDSHTTERIENSNVKFYLNNTENRDVKWYLYYNEDLIKEGQEEWAGDKILNIDDYIISANGKVTVKLVESNGVVTKLTSNSYIAEESETTLEEGGSYTPETPVRVITTPATSTSYYETITLNSINSSLEIDAGEGFENKLKISYSTTSDDTFLNNNEINIVTTMPEQDSDLNYTETVEGVLVPLESTSNSNFENIFELPEVMVEKTDGLLYRPDDYRLEGLEAISGGRRWYTKMTAENGVYNFVNTLNHVGVNLVKISYYNSYKIKGSLLGNANSTFKVIRVQNPSNPNYKYHQTYTLSELLDKINNQQ